MLVPLNADYSVELDVDLKEYTRERLLSIAAATEKGDLKKQARELFRFLKRWNLELEEGKIAHRDHKTLAQLPQGLALALAIEIGNRTGVITEPFDSGIVIERSPAGPQRTKSELGDKREEGRENAPKHKGWFRRLLRD